jgi:hypothetical protein
MFGRVVPLTLKEGILGPLLQELRKNPSKRGVLRAGHKTHVCKECTLMPKEKRPGIEQEDEVFGFLKQSHISAKNVARLKTLASSEDQRIAELAGIVLEVAQVKPYKK